MLTLVKNSGLSLGSCSKLSAYLLTYPLVKAQLKPGGLSEHPKETPYSSDLYCVLQLFSIWSSLIYISRNFTRGNSGPRSLQPRLNAGSELFSPAVAAVPLPKKQMRALI